MPKKLLELFSGTHSVGKVAIRKGYEVTSLDLDGNATINVNILEWDYKNAFPIGHFDIIWASPPCHTFSILRRSNIGKKLKKFGDNIVTAEILDDDMINNGVPILTKTLDIMEYFKPKLCFLENPDTGKMKDFIHNIPYVVVDYCQYSDWGYKKRTRIWYNGDLSHFKAKLCQVGCPNTIDGKGKKHKDNVSGNIKRTPLCDRYRIPEKLIDELII
jgi:hypothetical protein